MEHEKKRQETNHTCQLISCKELAKQLGLSKRQIHRLNAFGKIPKPLKIGGSLRFDQRAIAVWIRLGCPDRTEFEQFKELAKEC